MRCSKEEEGPSDAFVQKVEEHVVSGSIATSAVLTVPLQNILICAKAAEDYKQDSYMDLKHM